MPGVKVVFIAITWSRTRSSSFLRRRRRAACRRVSAAVEQNRARIGAGEGDAQIGELVAVAPERDRDAGDRIFDRAADADLVIGRAQARACPRATASTNSPGSSAR